MAKAGDDGGGDAGSWPGFLSELTKSFLILRDVFGYALPGAVFLSIGVLTRRFSLYDLQYFLGPYHLPLWLAAILGVGACYAAGHVMVQIAYFFFNTWKLPPRLTFWRPKSSDANSAADGALLASHHTQVPVALISLRGTHPELLIELDRQSIMTQLRGGTGAAMLTGFVVFYLFPTPPLGWMMGLAGAFLLVVFWWSAIPNIDNLRQRTVAAGQQAAAQKAPDKDDNTSLEQVIQDFIAAATDALRKR